MACRNARADFIRDMSLVCAPLIFVAFACTDARLYSDEGPAMQADRLTLRGRVCAQDTMAERLPLRIVIVADQAAGPLFSSFDPGGLRIQYLRDFVQSAVASEQTELAVIGYANRSRTLAPQEGNFTRNPGELLSAINQLAISEPCLTNGICRDYLEGLRTARSLIEGDMAQTEAGVRVLTEYAVVFLLAGPQVPLASNVDCCEVGDAACLRQDPQPSNECQSQRQQREIKALREAVETGGGLGVRVHVLHLAAEEEAVNEQLQSEMRDLAFEGLGSYTRIGSSEALSVSGTHVLEQRTDLKVKALIVSNINAKPSPAGPLVDSDADGLADDQESILETDPQNADTDGDGIGDLVETLTGIQPLQPDQPAACRQLKKAGQDSDLDGLSDCDEALLGTEPTLVDSDGDGMPDKLEVVGATDFLHSDAQADNDDDGVTNSDELSQHSDPRSDDNTARRTYRYRYEIEDEGVLEELYALPMGQLTGVEIVRMSAGTTPGVGILRYSNQKKTLSWQDGIDTSPGRAIDVSAEGMVELPSSSYAPVQGEEGKRIEVDIRFEDLPGVDVNERVRIIYRKRHCISYTVRNVRLMNTRNTGESDDGLNRIVLYFAEAPEGRTQRPGPFRMAEIPVVFTPPERRDPSAPAIVVFDEEFVRPK
ncbi:MAG: VWA domain-containing protein [Deltaproteobacteria bacterium]|nr:VWA domain-containing protein [Deltaproteobacteria bacterium]